MDTKERMKHRMPKDTTVASPELGRSDRRDFGLVSASGRVYLSAVCGFLNRIGSNQSIMKAKGRKPKVTRSPRRPASRPAGANSGKVMTIEQARDFVLREQVCTVLSRKLPGISSLWDAIGISATAPGKTKWGAKMEAVWTWKTELPARYPDEIFYGKIGGGTAVLMSIEYLRTKHYAEAHRSLPDCSRLAREIYELVRLDAPQTGPLRQKVLAKFGCTRGAFDKALEELQVTLNIVRSNAPEAIYDTWLPFSELYWREPES